jgi:hypothetical protein
MFHYPMGSFCIRKQPHLLQSSHSNRIRGIFYWYLAMCNFTYFTLSCSRLNVSLLQSILLINYLLEQLGEYRQKPSCSSLQDVINRKTKIEFFAVICIMIFTLQFKVKINAISISQMYCTYFELHLCG